MPKRDAQLDRYRALEQRHSRFLQLAGVHRRYAFILRVARRLRKDPAAKIGFIEEGWSLEDYNSVFGD